MNIKYVVAILAIVLMIGCAAPQPAAPAAEPPAAPAAEPPAMPEPPAADAPAEGAEAPAAVEGEIAVTKAGFDPAEMTVALGSIVTLNAVEGDHKFTIGGMSTPIVSEGTSYDATFDKVGKINIFDILTKKSAVITVTEQAGEMVTE
ncbi:MAG: hypothetical protein KKC75_00820 [Nanoarchaeota archaeon]|nr:hypothetical protein [Nanoarchaeota archaeon]MBU1005657.1 hypothetical protein [Nanoarchaeota archaeon]MBU1946918.1 hypothetical protein [Nanoarchaeota archaeon]